MRAAPESRQGTRRHFPRRTDAQAWLDEQTAKLESGTHVSPRSARVTVREWAETWLAGYGTRRPSSVKSARIHLLVIVEHFGDMQLAAVRPSHVKAWTAMLRAEGRADSYVYRLHGRLAQLFSDAVHDGILARSPCSRRTSPGWRASGPTSRPRTRCGSSTTCSRSGFASAILLGAFAGLRSAEACGLRVADVDFMRGVVSPAVQYPAEPLKSPTSETPIPIPASMAVQLSAQVASWPAETLLTNESGGQLSPTSLEVAMRAARSRGPGPTCRLPLPRSEALLRLDAHCERV